MAGIEDVNSVIAKCAHGYLQSFEIGCFSHGKVTGRSVSVIGVISFITVGIIGRVVNRITVLIGLILFIDGGGGVLRFTKKASQDA